MAPAVSRQMDYQRRNREAGLCVICGRRPIYLSWRCVEHYSLFRGYQLRRYHELHPAATYHRTYRRKATA